MYLVQDAREDVVDDRLSTAGGREAMPMAGGARTWSEGPEEAMTTGLGMGTIDSSQIPQALTESEGLAGTDSEQSSLSPELTHFTTTMQVEKWWEDWGNLRPAEVKRD